ncbi:MAG TPA: FecR domain-containing protein [Puia sp.]|uniref:FecR family protein n=1 Tax=Puia sp. TaxID=2045100 RepID=UPI002BB567D8|nr:FecR domain-containing protein [Puia sp.]HVU95758.1 FecR domain-containing protein [Puia sp.]
MNLQEAKQFVAHFVNGDYTREEYATFLRWLKGATLEELNDIADEHEAQHERWDVTGLMPSAEWKARLEGKLDDLGVEEAPIPVIGEKWSFRRKTWVAAASVVVVLGAGAIWYTQQGSVKPGFHKLTDFTSAVKTAENPKGGEDKKELLLADGSKVLLNVASTLRYPETFTGSERVVELSGEAYFEVKPNAARPFRVLVKDAEVDVLGTSFNVRAYGDESVCKTTLIDGSVSIESRSDKKKLTPGQQGIITYPSTGDIAIVPRVDIGDVMAWKTGYFVFRNEEFQVVARVLERYYNVEIEYDQNIAVTRVSGSVSRAKDLTANLRQFQGMKVSNHGTKVKVTL